MRILRIRGQNLASLESEFQVDLTDGALGRAGLFAITGPTGAGKSTLLDAVCLCLYDKTPRLAQRGGATVLLAGQDDEAALAANDQRNILRRGAGSGWAEVDFRGRDGRTWTARWEVHRARRRAEGKVQPQVLTLRDAQGQVVGGNKVETLDEIRQRVGLDFDQFRRSVLLAQGDFAAFLRADQNERAELLEQMTGTGIYTRLSQAAFFKRRELEGQLRELETRLDAQGVLSPDQRQAAQDALQAATAQRTTAIAAVAAAEAAVRWHQEQAALAQGVTGARDQLARAQAAWTAAQDRRDALARAERGWELRGLAREATQARQQATQAAAARDAAEHGRDRATREQAGAEARLATAQAALSRAHDARVAQVEDRLANARRGLGELQAWLDAHPQHGRMADPERVEQVATRLDERGQRARAVDQTTASLDGLQAAATQRTQDLAAAQQAVAQAEQAEAQATAQVHAAVQAAAAHDDSALLRQRRDLDLQDRALGELQRLADRADELSAQVQRATSDRDGAEQRHQQAAGQARQAVEAGQGLGPRLDEARAALALARAAVDATDLRATLQDGQPCPVCGSPDHPWADGSPVARLHDQQHQRVQQLEQQQADLATQAAAHQATAQAEAKARDVAAQLLGRATATLAELSTPWQAQAAALGQPDLAGPSDAQQALAAVRDDLAARQQALATQEAAARQARQAVEAARVRQQLARDQARKAAEAEKAADRAVLAAREALDKARTRLEADRERLAQLEVELAALLDPAAPELPVVGAWRQDASPVVAACRDAGAAWERHLRRREQATEAINQLEPDLAGYRERAEAARVAARAEDLALATAPTPPAGLAPPDLTAWLGDRVEALRQARDRAQQDAQAAVQAATAAAQAAAGAAAAATTLAEQAEGAQARLQQRLAERGLDADALAALRALDDAPQAARTLLAERQARLEAHQQARPEADADTATAALDAARTQQATADEAWSAARATLKADDAAQQRVAALQAQLVEQRRAAEPWLQLAACIGSGSGVEFKRFAQSLTLEALLEQANAHLRRLQPRYSLARIHGTDLDILVVDHDLGDEPRTIQSLSGGESFLTSLALALGLSSLSSRDVRVESLFIDEGFGTLDAQTLDVALDVLDGLQAAGRQVGVISHVGDLAVRIGVQVQVSPLGGGRSAVSVVEA